MQPLIWAGTLVIWTIQPLISYKSVISNKITLRENLKAKARKVLRALLRVGDYKDLTLYKVNADFNDPNCPLEVLWFSVANRFLTYWQTLLLILATYTLFMAPVLTVNPDLAETTYGETNFWIEIVIDLFFIADLCLNFVTPVERLGVTINVYSEVSRSYLTSWFAVDVIGALPLDLIAAIFGASHPAWRLNKMVRVLRLSYYWDCIEREMLTVSPTIIRVTKLTFLVILLTHVVGLVFVWIVLYEDIEDGAGYLGFTPEGRPFIDLYIAGFYWAISSMTGYGGTEPFTSIEAGYSWIVALVGCLVYTSVIGVAGSLVGSLDHGASQFRFQFESLQAFLSFRSIPPALRDTIIAYYRFVWETRRTFGTRSQIIDTLPTYLKVRLNMAMNADIINKISLFARLSSQCIERIVSVLQPRVMMPGTFVFRKGEVGREMFFINRGSVEIISEDDPPTVYKVLHEGDFFGEIALIFDDMKRTATIRARDYLDLYVLLKDDFVNIMADYPDQAAIIRTEAGTRIQSLRAMAGAADDECDEYEECEEDFDDDDDASDAARDAVLAQDDADAAAAGQPSIPGPLSVSGGGLSPTAPALGMLGGSDTLRRRGSVVSHASRASSARSARPRRVGAGGSLSVSVSSPGAAWSPRAPYHAVGSAIFDSSISRDGSLQVADGTLQSPAAHGDGVPSFLHLPTVSVVDVDADAQLAAAQAAAAARQGKDARGRRKLRAILSRAASPPAGTSGGNASHMLDLISALRRQSLTGSLPQPQPLPSPRHGSADVDVDVGAAGFALEHVDDDDVADSAAVPGDDAEGPPFRRGPGPSSVWAALSSSAFGVPSASPDRDAVPHSPDALANTSEVASPSRRLRGIARASRRGSAAGGGPPVASLSTLLLSAARAGSVEADIGDPAAADSQFDRPPASVTVSVPPMSITPPARPPGGRTPQRGRLRSALRAAVDSMALDGTISSAPVSLTHAGASPTPASPSLGAASPRVGASASMSPSGAFVEQSSMSPTDRDRAIGGPRRTPNISAVADGDIDDLLDVSGGDPGHAILPSGPVSLGAAARRVRRAAHLRALAGSKGW